MYLMDSNAFMEANRLYYAFDIAPRILEVAGSPIAGRAGWLDRCRQGRDHSWPRRSR